MRARRLVATIPAALAAFVTFSAAQSVHVVDISSGPFTTIRAAVEAAASGDVVLVRPGIYNEDVVIDGKSLILQGDNPSPEQVIVANVLVANLAASDFVAVRTMRLEGGGVIGAHSLRAVDCAGSVWFEALTISGEPRAFVAGGGSVTRCDAVSFVRCEFSTAFNLFAPTMELTDATVQLFGTTVPGLPGTSGPFLTTAGEQAITLRGGDLYVHSSTITGGRGGDGIGTCGTGSPGGDAIVLTGVAPTLHVIGSSVTGGAGGFGSGACADGANGRRFKQVSPSTILQDPGLAPGFVVFSPVRDGSTLQVTYTGQPGDQVWVAHPAFPGPRRTSPRWDGPLVVGLPAPSQFAGTLDVNGTLIQNIPVLNLGTGVQAAPLFTQAFFRSATRFAVSTPSLLTLVDVEF